MNYKQLKVLTLLSLGAITTLSMVGATAGTLAWYAYITKVDVSFRGTSVRKTEQLQVGLVDEMNPVTGKYHFTDEKLIYYGLSEITTLSSTKRIVWAPGGGGLTANVISEFVYNSEYRNNNVSPVSTRGRGLNDPVTIYSSLVDSSDIYEHDNPYGAAKKEYISVPFAFKVLNNRNIPMPDAHVWINDATIATEAGKKADKGVRAYFENVAEDKHILFNPSSTETEPGRTKIAGVLDLDGDGYYEYDKNNKREIVYGQYDNAELTNGHIKYSSTPYVPSNPEQVDDVNGVGDDTPSTFVAKHASGVYVADYTDLDCNYAYYDTLATVRPQIDPISGSFIEDSGKPVCLTGNDGIGFTNMTVFLEGWDLAIDDRSIDTTFNFGLLFEINKAY